MKNVRKQIRINTLHHALTTRLCFRAVYRLSRSVNDGIDESAYVIVLKKAGAVQVSFVRYRRWNVIHVHVDGGVGAFYAGERFYRQGDADFVYQYGKYKELKANDIARARRATEERAVPMAVKNVSHFSAQCV